MGKDGIYKVERILDHKQSGRGLKYLIKWEGYSDDENTWEPVSNLKDCSNLVAQYWEQRGDKPPEPPETPDKTKKKTKNAKHKLVKVENVIIGLHGEIQYEVCYDTGKQDTLDSVKIRKQNPILLIDFFEEQLRQDSYKSRKKNSQPSQ